MPAPRPPSPAFNHRQVEITAIRGAHWADAAGLSAVVVAAAGAVGMPALGPPVVREAPDGTAIGMLCRGGHIILHAVPAEGLCFVDIVARAPADVNRGVEVITRRLGVTA